MKKILLLSGAFLLSISAFTANAQQLPNVGFTNWKTCGSTLTVQNSYSDRPGVEPTDWNGSNVNQTVLGVNKQELGLVTKGEDSSNAYTQLKNIWIGMTIVWKKIGAVAPGFITLGTPWVYAESSTSNCDGGTVGGVDFTYRPDAITGKYKRTDSNSENSHIIAYLWNGTYTSNIGSIDGKTVQSIDDADKVVFGKTTGSASGNLVAKCDYTFSTTNSAWQTITVPLNYEDGAAAPTKMNVIICGGDYWTRGNLKENTTLLVDDVDFVYYSTLESLKVKGAQVALTSGTYNYTMTGKMPTASEVEAVCKSQFANAAVAVDSESYKVTITVTNQGGKDLDGETQHVYTLQYTAPEVKNYDGKLNVTMDGADVIANGDKAITITYYNDNTCDISLSDFMFMGQNLGDILVPGVNVTTDASGKKTFSDGKVEAMSLGEGAIYANVTIDGGTITAGGNVNMPITVGWMVEYPTSKTETPIEVKFTSNLAYTYTDEGYTYAIKNSDYTDPVYEKKSATLWAYKEGELGNITYTLEIEDSEGLDLTVTGLTAENEQYSGTDNDVKVNWKHGSYSGTTKYAVTVAGGKVAEGTRAGQYEVSFALPQATAGDPNYTIVFTTDEVSSSVEGLDADHFAARGINGAVAVSGFSGNVEVYTVDGRLAARKTVSGEAQLPMAAGIYVVRAANNTAKVIVK